VRRSREAGFEEHLVKPIERSTLFAAIARVAAPADPASLAVVGRPT
jgi:CheY-like chemotaxis protein